MATSNVFQNIGDIVTGATNAFLTPAINNIIEWVIQLCTAGVTLYLVILGYAIMTGHVPRRYYDYSQ